MWFVFAVLFLGAAVGLPTQLADPGWAGAGGLTVGLDPAASTILKDSISMIDTDCPARLDATLKLGLIYAGLSGWTEQARQALPPTYQKPAVLDLFNALTFDALRTTPYKTYVPVIEKIVARFAALRPIAGTGCPTGIATIIKIMTEIKNMVSEVSTMPCNQMCDPREMPKMIPNLRRIEGKLATVIPQTTPAVTTLFTKMHRIMGFVDSAMAPGMDFPGLCNAWWIKVVCATPASTSSPVGMSFMMKPWSGIFGSGSGIFGGSGMGMAGAGAPLPPQWEMIARSLNVPVPMTGDACYAKRMAAYKIVLISCLYKLDSILLTRTLEATVAPLMKAVPYVNWRSVAVQVEHSIKSMAFNDLEFIGMDPIVRSIMEQPEIMELKGVLTAAVAPSGVEPEHLAACIQRCVDLIAREMSICNLEPRMLTMVDQIFYTLPTILEPANLRTILMSKLMTFKLSSGIGMDMIQKVVADFMAIYQSVYPIHEGVMSAIRTDATSMKMTCLPILHALNGIRICCQRFGCTAIPSIYGMPSIYGNPITPTARIADIWTSSIPTAARIAGISSASAGVPFATPRSIRPIMVAGGNVIDIVEMVKTLGFSAHAPLAVIPMEQVRELFLQIIDRVFPINEDCARHVATNLIIGSARVHLEHQIEHEEGFIALLAQTLDAEIPYTERTVVINHLRTIMYDRLAKITYTTKDIEAVAAFFRQLTGFHTEAYYRPAVEICYTLTNNLVAMVTEMTRGGECSPARTAQIWQRAFAELRSLETPFTSVEMATIPPTSAAATQVIVEKLAPIMLGGVSKSLGFIATVYKCPVYELKFIYANYIAEIACFKSPVPTIRPVLHLIPKVNPIKLLNGPIVMDFVSAFIERLGGQMMSGSGVTATVAVPAHRIMASVQNIAESLITKMSGLAAHSIPTTTMPFSSKMTFPASGSGGEYYPGVATMTASAGAYDGGKLPYSLMRLVTRIDIGMIHMHPMILTKVIGLVLDEIQTDVAITPECIRTANAKLAAAFIKTIIHTEIMSGSPNSLLFETIYHALQRSHPELPIAHVEGIARIICARLTGIYTGAIEGLVLFKDTAEAEELIARLLVRPEGIATTPATIQQYLLECAKLIRAYYARHVACSPFSVETIVSECDIIHSRLHAPFAISGDEIAPIIAQPQVRQEIVNTLINVAVPQIRHFVINYLIIAKDCIIAPKPIFNDFLGRIIVMSFRCECPATNPAFHPIFCIYTSELRKELLSHFEAEYNIPVSMAAPMIEQAYLSALKVVNMATHAATISAAGGSSATSYNPWARSYYIPSSMKTTTVF